MDKGAIKTFAIDARKKLIADCAYRAGLVGITEKGISDPNTLIDGVQRFEYAPNEFFQISGKEILQRDSLVKRVNEAGFNQVIEEVAYSWFNRIIAIRFMEVRGYLPVRVLSSATKGKVEPDIVTEAPDVNLGLKSDCGFSSEESEEVLRLKTENKTDELFRILFIKQCNALNPYLPGVFQRTEDYSELLLNISYTKTDGIVRRLISEISEDDFNEAVEIIGWLYQYYNSELKDDTFARLKKNHKITKERIPSATQLFTPEWIVRYMVENSLGRLWLDGHPDESLKTEWKYYLDEAEQEPEVLEKLSELRKDAAKLKPEDITIIDPCMGSGHILVYAFDVLMQIYQKAGYQPRDAARLIVEKNLHGLDIDDRAGQLAYFAVMMKAREYNRRILTEGISPGLYSIQESNGISDSLVDWVSEKDNSMKAELQSLVDIFKDAKEYGSILNVPEMNFSQMNERISKIRNSKSTFLSYDSEFELLASIIKQGELLASKYDVVVTNPPYMGGGGMNLKLSNFVQINYPNSKADLFAVFIEKCLNLIKENCYQAMITQHAWMFLSSYTDFRNKLLQYDTVCMAHLGPHAFEEINGEIVQTTSWVSRKSNLELYLAKYLRLVEYSSQQNKENAYLNGANCYISAKNDFSKIPNNTVAYWISKNFISIFKNNPLSDFSEPRVGLQTGNNDLFFRSWYEVDYKNCAYNIHSSEESINSQCKWFPINKGGKFRRWYGNNQIVVDWYNNGENLKSFSGSVLRNQQYYFKESLTWSRISSSELGIRYSPCGFIFDTAGACLYASADELYYLLGVLSSKVVSLILQVICPTLTIQVGDLSKFPIIMNQQLITKVNPVVIQNISFSKTDWDSFETSWDFEKHPFLTYKGETVEKSFKNWESFTESQFNQLKANEEELNRIFIEIYGLQDELTPEVEEKDVTIRKADLLRDVKSFISYAVGCMFGRYSLDVPGLAYAGGDWDESKYKSFLPDNDAIIPINDTEYFEDDIVGRFVVFLKTAFGSENLEENLTFIADSLGTKGDSARDKIRNYFLKDFYKDHLKIYQKRPIYWLFDSGKENGFKALIYLHRYNIDTVGRVRTDYLHKTQKAIEYAIERCNYRIEKGSPSEQRKAEGEQAKLTRQLAETRVYDAAIAQIAHRRIFLDLDDGVVVNHAKFQDIVIKEEGRNEQKISLLANLK